INVSAESDAVDVLALTHAVVEAGAPVIQLRAKGIPDAAAYTLAGRVADVCRAGGATLVVNDRTDIAVAVGADGAHVGDDDLPVAAARAVLGPAAVLGATARTTSMAKQAAADGATYVGVGPCYATTTKVVQADLLGPAGMAEIAGAVGLPVI